MIWKNSKSGEQTLRKIDFFDFAEAPSEITQLWKSEINEVINSGTFIGGSFVKTFEVNFAEYLGAQYCVGTGNGYDALVIALLAVEIKAGDRIAVPSHTFIATWLAINAVGAIPVGIDCDATGQMDLDVLESVGNSLRAVLIVHMHGQMVDMTRLTNWAKSNEMKLIEDCAQSHGAMSKGKKAGTWGDVAAFSFYPTKNLGALGDGGAVITNNPIIANTARKIANYGSSLESKYRYEIKGINSRLDSIQAAVLNVNLQYLDMWNAHRIKLANMYKKRLNNLNLKMLENSEESVFHHFVILTSKRDNLREFLAKKGIGSEIHYPECAQISYEKISRSFRKSDAPANAIEFSKTCLSLPLSQWMSEERLDFISVAMTDAKSEEIV